LIRLEGSVDQRWRIPTPFPAVDSAASYLIISKRKVRVVTAGAACAFVAGEPGIEEELSA
jgi:hypothetical protein